MKSLNIISKIMISDRVKSLKDSTLEEKRYISLEQAGIITECYKKNKDDPRIIIRSKALKESLRNIKIRIDPRELIVGNRTEGIRSGVIFPEAVVSWIDKEIHTFSTRPQDKFNVKKGDIDKLVPRKIYFTLREVVELKNTNYKTACNKKNTTGQPNRGVPDIIVNGKKMWDRNTVIEWIMLSDEEILKSIEDGVK